MVDGEARLFRITPCSTQPDSARQIPTSPPVRILGKRRFQMMSRDGEPSSTNMARSTSRGENSIVPMPTQNTTDRTLSASSTTTTTMARMCFFIPVMPYASFRKSRTAARQPARSFSSGCPCESFCRSKCAGVILPSRSFFSVRARSIAPWQR